MDNGISDSSESMKLAVKFVAASSGNRLESNVGYNPAVGPSCCV